MYEREREIKFVIIIFNSDKTSLIHYMLICVAYTMKLLFSVNQAMGGVVRT